MNVVVVVRIVFEPAGVLLFIPIYYCEEVPHAGSKTSVSARGTSGLRAAQLNTHFIYMVSVRGDRRRRRRRAAAGTLPNKHYMCAMFCVVQRTLALCIYIRCVVDARALRVFFVLYTAELFIM